MSYASHITASAIFGLALAAFSILVGASWEGVHLSHLVAPTCLLIVGSVGVMALLFGRQRDGNATLNAALRWHQVARYYPIAGILGALLGLIHVMLMLDQPDKIGPGLAVAFTAVVYSIVFFAFSHAWSERMTMHAMKEGADVNVIPLTNTAGLLGFVQILILLLSLFVVLYALGN